MALQNRVAMSVSDTGAARELIISLGMRQVILTGAYCHLYVFLSKQSGNGVSHSPGSRNSLSL